MEFQDGYIIADPSRTRARRNAYQRYGWSVYGADGRLLCRALAACDRQEIPGRAAHYAYYLELTDCYRVPSLSSSPALDGTPRAFISLEAAEWLAIFDRHNPRAMPRIADYLERELAVRLAGWWRATPRGIREQEQR